MLRRPVWRSPVGVDAAVCHTGSAESNFSLFTKAAPEPAAT
jgi:hypothetical protein